METLELVKSDYVTGRIGLDQFEEDVWAILNGTDPKRFRDGCHGRIEWVKSVFAHLDDEDRDATDEERAFVECLLREVEMLKEEEEQVRRTRADLARILA